jgi:hypothetical protein
MPQRNIGVFLFKEQFKELNNNKAMRPFLKRGTLEKGFLFGGVK